MYYTGLTGLEPATSAVTGRRSNQLNYSPNNFNIKKEYFRRKRDSNPWYQKTWHNKLAICRNKPLCHFSLALVGIEPTTSGL